MIRRAPLGDFEAVSSCPHTQLRLVFMSDDSFADDASSDDAFGDFRDSFEGEEGAGDEEDPLSPPPELSGRASALDPSLALDLARTWVREHQNTTMLGAFAVGVFVGSLLRN